MMGPVIEEVLQQLPQRAFVLLSGHVTVANRLVQQRIAPCAAEIENQGIKALAGGGEIGEIGELDIVSVVFSMNSTCGPRQYVSVSPSIV